ncbi:MAG TPA: transmembrane 220 family protein [Polyangiaceae bacterium]|nr:transmembrane 220 family protein [Polyangiaceae bacterium]
MILQLFNALFALAFALAALLQYNDPDPYLWMPTYLAAVGCCVAFARGKLHPAVAYVLAGIACVWSLTLMPSVVRHPPALAEVFGDVKMYAPGVEEARETGGLWLIAGWLFTLARASRRQRRGMTTSKLESP